MLDEKKKLSHIISLGMELASFKDLDMVLEKILTEARRFVNAEAGSIYIRDGETLRFSHTQNEELQRRLPPDKKLIYSTFSIPINNKSIAGYVAGNGEVVNIPDVCHLSHDAPYSFDQEYDRISCYRTRSLITLPLKTHQGGNVGVLQLINARDEGNRIGPFVEEDAPLIRHYANNAAIAIEQAQMTRAIILRAIKIAELRDPKETGAHVNRVAAYSVEIYETWAKNRGMPDNEILRNKDILRMGAMLHDVGKVAIPDSILKKPARLDPEEYAVMKQHTYLGAQLFSDIYSDFDEAAALIALNHHERWDGGGYPGHIEISTGQPLLAYQNEHGGATGKKGEEIPVFGRVVAIADVYDALSSKRAYKQAWSEEDVLQNLREERGRQFDPEMIDAFFKSVDVIRAVTNRYPD